MTAPIDPLLPSDEHWDELNRWIRLVNERGHTGMFARAIGSADLQVIERSVVAEWQRSIEEKWQVESTGLSSNPADPPDCFVDMGEQRLGVELAELVDGEVLAKIREARKRDGVQLNSAHGELFCLNGPAVGSTRR